MEEGDMRRADIIFSILLDGWRMKSRTVGVLPPLLYVAQQWRRGFGWFTLQLVFVHEFVHNVEQGYMN